MLGSVRSLARSDQGAIAPLTAMTLFGLIAVGGIAFDYARLASMDTELQQAADQAALAAATQLDGQTGSCARAAAAASGLLANRTLFSNDGDGTSVVVPTSGVANCAGNAAIQFYQSYNRVTDTPGPVATADDNAKIVIVSITPREAFYSLTPIVAAFRSGDINAQAVAALGSSICKTPPVMICNPTESGSSTTFDPAAYIGDGLRLSAVGNGTGTWVPGNFGYLQTGGGSSGAPGIREALGWNTPPGNCLPDNGVDTKPGATTTVTDALNTRFDIYDSGQSCPTGGSCSASMNSFKDLRRPANANNNNGCAAGPQGWQLDDSGAGYYGQNVPTSATALPVTTILSAMGHPRDMCHAVSNSGSCTGDRIGDGFWDADAYFRTNYVRSVDSAGGAAGTRWTSAQWQANTGLSPTAPRAIPGTPTPNPAFASRYNVYQWEMTQRDNLVDGVVVLGPRAVGATGNALVSYGKPQCSAPHGFGSGVVPGPTVPDRRRISVAVVNCIAEDVKGSSTGVQVEKWIDVFLVEPSANRSRTNNGDLYAEIIGEALSGGAGSTVAQVVRHDLPYLIK